MASNKSRGSGVTSSRSTMAQRMVAQQTPQPAPQIPIQQAQPDQVVPTVQQAQTANNGVFKDHDDADYHDLYNGRGYFQNQQFGIDSEVARQNYLVNSPEPGSVGGDNVHSPSQNMNWELMNNLPMSPTHQMMRDGLDDAMHNLGYNLNLQRYPTYGAMRPFRLAVCYTVGSDSRISHRFMPRRRDRCRLLKCRSARRTELLFRHAGGYTARCNGGYSHYIVPPLRDDRLRCKHRIANAAVAPARQAVGCTGRGIAFILHCLVPRCRDRLLLHKHRVTPCTVFSFRLARCYAGRGIAGVNDLHMP